MNETIKIVTGYYLICGISCLQPMTGNLLPSASSGARGRQREGCG